MMKKGGQTNAFQLGFGARPPVADLTSCQHPSARKGGGSVILRAERTARKRLKKLEAYDALRLKGLTAAEASRETRVPLVTLWRWKKNGVKPRTSNCGRRSILERFEVP